MAPLPVDNTKRWFLDYTTCGEQHTLLMRSGDDVDATQASTALAAFLDAITSQIRQVTIDALRSAANGSTISLPEVWTGDPTYGGSAGSHDESARYMDFVGRGPSGRRVREAVFGGINVAVGNDYRVSEAESTVVADAITALTADPDCFLTIAGDVPIWSRYFNIGVNAYWRNKIR